MYRFFFWSLFAHIGSGVWVVLSIGLAKGPVNPQCVSHLPQPPACSWQWLWRQPCSPHRRASSHYRVWSSPLNLLYFDSPELNHRVPPSLLSHGSKSESRTLLLLPCEALLPLQRFLFFGSIRHSCMVHEIINQNLTSENLKCKYKSVCP
jgi:hypothetical protein